MLKLRVGPRATLAIIGEDGTWRAFRRDELPGVAGEAVAVRDRDGRMVGWIERARGGKGDVIIALAPAWRVVRLEDRPRGQKTEVRHE